MAFSVRYEQALSAFLSALDRDVLNTQSPIDDTTALVIMDFVASLTCASTELIGLTASDPVSRAEYIKLLTVHVYQDFILSIGQFNMHVKLDPIQTYHTSRLAWIAYVLLRFGLRECNVPRLSQRLLTISQHHQQSMSDMHFTVNILRRTMLPRYSTEIAIRCGRWAVICSELTSQRSDLASSVYEKLTRLSTERNVHAYIDFTRRGGHEGCLRLTPWEDLEPILFNSPYPISALYVTTMHMLKEVITDGSVFSDDPIPADNIRLV